MPRFREVLDELPYKDVSDFELESEIAEVAGSAISKAFWKDRAGERWFAKSEVFVTNDIAEKEAFLESCANKMYAYYGVPVARLAIATLPCSYTKNDERGDSLVSLGRMRAPHLLSRWVDRFNCYPGLPSFSGEQQNFSLEINYQKLNEQGLGHILAVAHFIHDIDVIGGSGKNVGYRFRVDGDQLKVISSKIDPGSAFWGFRGQDEGMWREASQIVTDTIRIATGGEGKDVIIKFANLPQQTKVEFITTVRDIINTPHEDLIRLFQHCPNRNLELISTMIERLKHRQMGLSKTFDTELNHSLAEEIQQLEQRISRLRLEEQTRTLEDSMLQQIYIHNRFANQDFLYKQAQAKELYIELSTANRPYNPQFTQITVPLVKDFQTFLQDDAISKILVLLGDGGTGKSIATQRWRETLWERLYTSSDISQEWVPIHIELKKFSKRTVPNCVINTLIDEYKLTVAQINSLKRNYRCLIILDGFDEVDGGLKCNFWETNKLSEWYDAKMLITSRIDLLSSEDLLQYLSVSGVVGSNIVRYLIPFNKEDIVDFLHKNIRNDSQDWEQLLTQQPTLANLLGIPLLLRIFKEAWPILSTRIQNDLTRFKLYEAFIEQWFKNNRDRLVEVLGTLQIQVSFYEYSKNLAFVMYEQNRLELNKEDTSVWSQFFNPNNEKINQARLGCPLRKIGETYSFIHRSFLEYFVAKHLWEHLDSESHFLAQWNVRNLTEEPEIINFLADLFNSGFKDKRSLQIGDLNFADKVSLQRHCINYVKNCRSNPAYYSKAVAGAMSFLNAVHTSFSGEDFSKLDLTGANLCGAILDGTDFTQSNLANVILRNAFLRGTCFMGSELTNADFGEKYYETLPLRSSGSIVIGNPLLGEEVSNITCCVKDQEVYLAMLVEKQVSIIDLKSSRLTETVKISNEYPEELPTVAVLSPIGNILVIGSNSGNIFVYDISQKKIISNFKGHEDAIILMKISADFRRLLSVSISCFDVMSAKELETLSIKTLLEIPLQKKAKDITIKLWDVSNKSYINLSNINLSKYNNGILSASFAPNNKFLAIGSRDDSYSIRILSLITGECVFELLGHEAPVTDILYSSEKTLISGSVDKTLRIWDCDSGSCIKVLRRHTKSISCIAFSQDTDLLVSGGEDNVVYVWETNNDYYNCIGEIRGHGNMTDVSMGISIKSLCFITQYGELNKKTFLAIGCEGSTKIRLVSVDNLPLFQRNVNYECSKVCFNQNLHKIYTLSIDNVFAVRDINGELGEKFYPLGYYGWSAFVQNGQKIITITKEGNVHIFDTYLKNSELAFHLEQLSEAFLHSLIPQQEGFFYKSFMLSKPTVMVTSEDGTYLAIAKEKDIYIWQINTKQFIGILRGHSTSVTAICFNFKAVLLASIDENEQIHIWNISQFRCQKIIVRKDRKEGTSQGEITQLKFSPDGKWLVSAGRRDTIDIWRADIEGIGEGLGLSKQEPRMLKNFHTRVGCVCFSADGTILAASDYNTVSCWKVESWEVLETQRCYKSPVVDMKFSNDGLYFITINEYSFKIWEVLALTLDCNGKNLQIFKTQLNSCNIYELITEQVNFHLARGLSSDNEELLVFSQVLSKRTLIGALNCANLSLILLHMRRYDYTPNDDVIHEGLSALNNSILAGSLLLVKFLLTSGCSLNKTNSLGHTPIMVAIMERQVVIAKYLLYFGADLTIQDNTGFTALHWAIDRNLIIKELLDNGARIDIKDKQGITPLLLAVQSMSFFAIKAMLNKTTSIRTLIDLLPDCMKMIAGLEVLNFVRELNELAEAVVRNDLPAVEVLVKKGISVKHTEPNTGCTPLLLAAGHGHLTIVQWLLQNGSHLNEVNDFGANILHIAAQQGKVAIIRWLLEESDIDIHVKNNEGCNALFIALNSKQLIVLEHFKQYLKKHPTYNTIFVSPLQELSSYYGNFNLGICFDIEKVNEVEYGKKCWEIFWQAIQPKEIGAAILREGDIISTTLKDPIRVFCISIESSNEYVIENIQSIFVINEQFKLLYAFPMFINGSNKMLCDAGRIDDENNISFRYEHSSAAISFKKSIKDLYDSKGAQEQSDSSEEGQEHNISLTRTPPPTAIPTPILFQNTPIVSSDSIERQNIPPPITLQYDAQRQASSSTSINEGRSPQRPTQSNQQEATGVTFTRCCVIC